MSGRILILDSVPTNRIVLKVKMLAAQYAVDTAASQAEAQALIALRRPDLMLVNLSDHIEDRHAFCAALKSDEDTDDIAIVAIGIADTTRARFAALDAGVDDVMPRPIEDALLLARIRSLLRMRHAGQELWLRDGTSRALGFDERRANFSGVAKVALLPTQAGQLQRWVPYLKNSFGPSLTEHRIDADIPIHLGAITPDIVIIDATGANTSERKGLICQLAADLRSRSESRFAAQLVMAPAADQQFAALLLDLGVDDVVPGTLALEELSLRADVLIGRKQQQDRLRDAVRHGMQAAVRDPLTGLYNRRYAEPHLNRMAQQAEASGREFAVMMIDIDHFKSINDTFGHAVGDIVLVELSARLRCNLRAIDLVARMGGEEFLVAMPQTNPKQAAVAAERLRHLITDAPFDIGKSHPPLEITVSVGVAVMRKEMPQVQSLGEMVDRADAALYAAKSGGRNMVRMASDAA